MRKHCASGRQWYKQRYLLGNCIYVTIDSVQICTGALFLCTVSVQLLLGLSPATMQE